VQTFPFPSGFRAVDEGTPAHSAVEDANDQLRNEGIQRPSNSPSPKSWAAAQREIAALRAANQKLRQRSTTPRKKGYQKSRRGQSVQD